MRKFASFTITKTIYPPKYNHPDTFDLEVKNTANQRIPYRLYAGPSFDKLLETAKEYNLDVYNHPMRVLKFDDNGHLIS